jgi:hypothetical protein
MLRIKDAEESRRSKKYRIDKKPVQDKTKQQRKSEVLLAWGVGSSPDDGSGVQNVARTGHPSLPCG